MKEDILGKIKKRFSKKIIDFQEHSKMRLYLELAPCDIPEAAKYLFGELGARFVTASGMDSPNNIEILYHFTFDTTGVILSVRTKIDKGLLEIESITPIIRAAEWVEREIYEMLGVKFRNHPNLKKLLLPDDAPENEYPLRKCPIK